MTQEKKVVFNSEWDRKFIKESWTFPFGSLMAAYAQMNIADVDFNFEQFKKHSLELQELAMKMTENALLRSQEGLEGKEELDVPTE